MDQTIDLTYLNAGRDYLRALLQLGLNPDCLFWAQDEFIGENVLVLVSSQFDRVGPLALSKTLFKAYNAAGTPKEISPFIIRMHSPEQAIIKQLANMVAVKIEYKPVADEPVPFKFEMQGGGLRFDHTLIYKFQLPSKKPPAQLARQWRRFSENVDKLAA